MAPFSDQLLLDIKTFNNFDAINAMQRANLHLVTDSQSSTLLHYAAGWGNDIVVLQLIGMGAAVNAQDRYDRTPLMLSLQKNRMSTMKILLDAGANIYISNLVGCSSLEMVVCDACPDLSVLKIFFEKVKEHCSNMKEIARILFSANCLLHHVIIWNKPNLTEYLLEAGAPVDSPHPTTGITALHAAVALVSLENVRLLLDYGADVNARSLNDRTPLMYFRKHDDSDDNLNILRLLLDEDIDIYATDTFGKSGMCRILQYGYPKVVSVFLQDDISLTEKDCGCAPLHYLSENVNTDIIKEIQWMKFDFNIRDGMDGTPLHLAADRCNTTTVDFLLQNRANINVEDSDGNTPLFYALTSGNYRKSSVKRRMACVELLLQSGADVECEDYMSGLGFEMISNYRHHYGFYRPVLMYIAINEKLGKSYKNSFIINEIKSNYYLKRRLQLYRREIKEAQKITVYGSITLFKLLSMSNRKLVWYLYNPQIVQRMLRISIKGIFKSYCLQQLRRRVKRAIRIAQLRKQAALAICRMAKLNEGFCSLVLDQILDYLNDWDVMNILNV